MTRKLWRLGVWAGLFAGSVLWMLPSGCLTSTAQRIVVATVFD